MNTLYIAISLSKNLKALCWLNTQRKGNQKQIVINLQYGYGTQHQH